MVDTQSSLQHLSTVQIVNSEHSTARIAVLQEAKPARGSSLLVTKKIDMDNDTILLENREDVALGQHGLQPADVHHAG